MAIPPIAALDIGSSRIVVLVGEADSDNRIRVVGKGINVSKGVRKGIVTNLPHADLCIRQAVKLAVEESDIDIGRVLIAASGGYISSFVNIGSAPVRSRDHIVTEDDIDEVRENAGNVTLPLPTHAVMHTIEQKFRLDGHSDIVSPEGMQGTTLSMGMLIVHADRGPIENLRNVASVASLNVDDVVFSAICAAKAVLSQSQKNAGVAVVDMGGGTTSYFGYVDGVPANAGSFSVGGDHVTNDIALAFNIPQNRAEDIKREYGNALVGGGSERIALPADFGLRDRTISLKAIRTVVNARLDETLKILRTQFIKDDILQKLGAGIVFTGGAASIPGLVELAQNIFGVPCTIGVPRNVSGLDNIAAPNSFAVSAGLLLYGLEAYIAERKAGGGFLDSLRRIFS